MLKELETMASKLSETRAMLSRALDRLTEEQATKIMINPEWSVKDEVAHLVSSERGMTGMAKRFATNENPQLPKDYNNDVYNARQVAKRKAMSFAEVRAELDASRKDLLAFLETVTPQQLDYPGEHPLKGQITLKELLVVIYSHETAHCKEISEKISESKK
jgi:uncharacterized damage-inducible protein DinB